MVSVNHNEESSFDYFGIGENKRPSRGVWILPFHKVDQEFSGVLQFLVVSIFLIHIFRAVSGRDDTHSLELHTELFQGPLAISVFVGRDLDDVKLGRLKTDKNNELSF